MGDDENMVIEVRWTTDVESSIYKDALAIRRKVFIEEQNVSEAEEIDGLDASCHHLVLYENNTPIATARIYEKEKNFYKIQRVAVSKNKRGQGLGAKTILEAEHKIKELNGEKILLGAQLHALAFYQKLGYEIASEEYLDAGIPHHDVIKNLN